MHQQKYGFPEKVNELSLSLMESIAKRIVEIEREIPLSTTSKQLDYLENALDHHRGMLKKLIINTSLDNMQ